MTQKIGIIGRGFVGSAVAFGFSPNTGFDAQVKIFDKDSTRSQNTLDETVNSSDFLFISVPTPAGPDGKIDLSILTECIKDIDAIITDKSAKETIILLRSTIVPGTTEAYTKKFPRLRLVFNPEFLTERSANFDFISQTRYVLGGARADTEEVAKLYKERFGDGISIILTDFKSAELTKYLCNCYFATKISFLNEMKVLSDSIGANWSDVKEGFIRDGRIGHSHMNVPGHDGKKGFGGSCFPKDMQAIINYASELEVNLHTINGAWKTNLEVRPEKDWENLKGRAVSYKKENQS